MGKKLTKVSLDVALSDWFNTLIKDNNLNVEVRKFIHDESMPDYMEVKWDLEGDRGALQFILDQVDDTLVSVSIGDNSDEDDGIFIHTYWLHIYPDSCYADEVASIAKHTGGSYDQYACMEEGDIDWANICNIYEWGQVV